MLDPQMMSAWKRWRGLVESAPARERTGLSVQEWSALPFEATRWFVDFHRLDQEVARG